MCHGKALQNKKSPQQTIGPTNGMDNRPKNGELTIFISFDLQFHDISARWCADKSGADKRVLGTFAKVC
jgi:hypothetical protein